MGVVGQRPGPFIPRDRAGTLCIDTTVFCHVTSSALRTNQFCYSELVTASLNRHKVIEQKYVFLFSVQLLPETFLILRRMERDMMKSVFWSAYKILGVC